MRIIAGEFRHRTLLSPPDSETSRPIPDRVKESLFSLLRGHFEGAAVFEGFAGVGTIGLECLSRGAERVVMVEQDRRVAELLKRNVATLECEDRCDVVVGDALGMGALARSPRPLHLAFLDPPYPLVQEEIGFSRVMAQLSRLIELLDDTGYAVVRTPWPLRFEVGKVVAMPAAVAPRRFKKKGKERDRWKRELRRATPERRPEPVELTEAEIEAAMAGEAPSAVDEGAPAKPEFKLADMTLANAVGPETHEYRGMAVHLYMKKKA
ncbi:Ribosomal RNA small subunit methyltransferase D [Phycisphaerales bacterium]|nr:Ribosomal RNA small subunit methyltransferase D [Phycisphaerales bacterium]